MGEPGIRLVGFKYTLAGLGGRTCRVDFNTAMATVFGKGEPGT